jgi:hypothetical protein
VHVTSLIAFAEYGMFVVEDPALLERAAAGDVGVVNAACHSSVGPVPVNGPSVNASCTGSGVNTACVNAVCHVHV